MMRRGKRAGAKEKEKKGTSKKGRDGGRNAARGWKILLKWIAGGEIIEGRGARRKAKHQKLAIGIVKGSSAEAQGSDTAKGWSSFKTRRAMQLQKKCANCCLPKLIQRFTKAAIKKETNPSSQTIVMTTSILRTTQIKPATFAFQAHPAKDLAKTRGIFIFPPNFGESFRKSTRATSRDHVIRRCEGAICVYLNWFLVYFWNYFGVKDCTPNWNIWCWIWF